MYERLPGRPISGGARPGSSPSRFSNSSSRPAGRFGSSRPSSSGSRFGAPQGGSRGGRGGRGSKSFLDLSKFINKPTAAEEAHVAEITNKFADFQIDERLKNSILSKGYDIPTPIQDQSIPLILEGRDIVGMANTGTGKTAAFLIPLINKVLLNPNEQVLVMAPTRELAIQIEAELKEFTRNIKPAIFSVCCVGGMYIGHQIRELRYKNNFIIGTPGRLKDLIDRKMIRLNEFNTVVLDEADQMLDMGFINDMRFIMDRMPKPRHTLFFSATLSPTIEKIIADFLTNPVRVSVKTRDTSKNIEQDVIRVGRDGSKFDVLHNLLSGDEFSKVLVFGKTKHGVEKISQELTKKGINAQSIHGDKDHRARQRALGQFKDNQVKVLVATDVAARGLDIPDVTHVINYDLPASYEDYVHRIGRTGRGNKKGKALTFIN
jgi:superfamily II DNA/RNA helicase